MNEDNLSLNNTGNVADVQQNPLEREVTGIPQDIQSANGVEDTNMSSPQMAPQYNPLTDPQRVEYWQSRSDRVLQENQELNQYKELANFIASNPDLADAVRNKVQGNIQPQATLPDLPQAPSDYDEYDAYNNPDSSSFQYRVGFEKAQRDLFKYTVEKMKSEEQGRQRAMEQERVNKENYQKISGVANVLRSQYSYNDNEIKDFFTTMSNPNTLSMENLIRFHRFLKGGQGRPYQSPTVPTGGGGAQRTGNSGDAGSNFNSFLKTK